MSHRLAPLIVLLAFACKSDPPVVTNLPTELPDADGDGFTSDVDCDDDTAAVNPDADELCDGIDNDCDGLTDDGSATDATAWYTDFDADGFGDPSGSVLACEAPNGAVADANDCDDTVAAVNPDADEVCDGIDNDCDTVVDDGVPVDAPTWYADTDADGFGDPGMAIDACVAPAAHVDNADDCDDADGLTNPDGVEICGGGDEDCDGFVDDDDDDAHGRLTFWTDADADTYGDPTSPVEACVQPAGTVDDDQDCNDLSDASYPGAPELCDGTDNDCDTLIDDNDDDTPVDATAWYLDADGDLYGDLASEVFSCLPIADRIQDGSDCDDLRDDISPSADEICDGDDNDCDTLADEADDDLIGTLYYADGDADLYGDDTDAVVACSLPAGRSPTPGDCDDGNELVNPDADEICDGDDNDCDTLVDDADDVLVGAPVFYVDSDGDGYGDISQPLEACAQPPDTIDNGQDCDDLRDDVNPDATEVCDGIDNDCSPLTSEEGILLLEGAEHAGDLQSALDTAAAGETVSVCRGTYPGPFTITSDIVLEGLGNPANVILDGQGLGSTLDTVGAAPTVRNLTLTGGTGTPDLTDATITRGGGLYADGGTFVDLVVTGNSAVYGGGIRCDGCAVTGGRVHLNQAVSYAGIAVNSGASVVDVVVEENTAAYDTGLGFGGLGGGIALFGGSTGTGLTVRDNVADAGGGAFLTYSSLTDSQILGNQATDDGGGLYVHRSGVVADSTFTGNSAADFGGGMVVYGEVDVSGSTFTANTARLGAGLGQYGDLPAALATNDADGDGLSDTDEADTHGTDPLVADTDGDGVPDGMEISLGLDAGSPDSDGDGEPDLEDLVPVFTGSTFDGNVASEQGGGLVVSRARLIDTTLEANEAGLDGGGLYQFDVLETDFVLLDGVTLRANVALEDGGGLRAEDAEVRHSLLEDNVAGDVGGAALIVGSLVVHDPDLLRPRTRFESNQANRGGGVFAENARLLVHAAMVGNTATVQGGAFEIFNGEAWLELGEVSGNQATYGGVVYAQGDSWTRIVADISDGDAAWGGVAHVGNGGTLVIADSVLAGQADNGGVVWVDENGTLLVHDSSLSGAATTSGGALYVEGEARLVRTDVVGSSATSGGGAYLSSNGVLWLTDSDFGPAAGGDANSPGDVTVDLVDVGTLPPTATVCDPLLGGCTAGGSPDPYFYTVLEDDDGLVDTGVDADRAEVIALDTGEAFFVGYAQTGVGPALGWFGEDCYLGTYCHPMAPDGGTLTRVGSLAAIVEGSTMLLPVDYPELITPGVTWLAIGATSGSCWVWGDDPSYYAALACTEL